MSKYPIINMKPRGRSKKMRQVQDTPRVQQFSPRGKPGRPDEIVIELDEFEAIRLADYLGMRQLQASKSMGVSQQTFSRILKCARKSIADGLLKGKIIKVKIDNDTVKVRYPQKCNLPEGKGSQNPIIRKTKT